MRFIEVIKKSIFLQSCFLMPRLMTRGRGGTECTCTRFHRWQTVNTRVTEGPRRHKLCKIWEQSNTSTCVIVVDVRPLLRLGLWSWIYTYKIRQRRFDFKPSPALHAFTKRNENGATLCGCGHINFKEVDICNAFYLLRLKGDHSCGQIWAPGIITTFIFMAPLHSVISQICL